MPISNYPENFIDLNSIDQKELNIVVVIEGSDTTFSLVPTYKKLRYGDPDVFYGDPGLVYGGLIPITTNKAILSSNSNLVISQKIEPEQGRASAALFSLEFVDLNGFMSSFVSPTGQYLDEILGGKQIKIYLGHKNSSFKEDYFCVFRGYVSSTTFQPSKILMQLTDANIKRKQQIFYTGKTKISARTLSVLFSNVNTTANTITSTAHGLVNNSKIAFYNVGGSTLPSPLIAGTEYYAIYVNGNSFKVTAAPNGGEIDLTTQGSGTFEIDLLEIGDGTGVVYFDNLSGFVVPKLGPNGAYDTSLEPYIKIDDEIIGYGPTSISGNTINLTARGARSTAAANHAAQADVDNIFALTGNIIDLALKIMLSGGNTLSSIPIKNFVQTDDVSLGLISNAIVLPNGFDAVDDYGCAVGDYVTVSGGVNAGVGVITGFDDANGYPNSVIYTDQTYTFETNSTEVFSLRSQYDTLPDSICTGLRTLDVDVSGWKTVQRNYAFQSDNTFSILVTQPESGKEFVEKELLLPAGLYGITRFGRISASSTKPPVAGEGLQTLDATNVVSPESIQNQRAINTRRFFNEVQYRYDLSNDGKPLSVTALIDTTSLNKFDTSSVLPITAKGLRTALGASTFIQRRGGFLLRRYSNVAYEITLQTNFKVAALIEVSDVVALVDNGGLQILNWSTGVRDIGAQLFEVIQRTLDLKTGRGTLTLLSQIGYDITDRFGGISPSSVVQAGSTVSEIKIAGSFTSKYGAREWRKWYDIIGDQIQIHSKDYSTVYVTTLKALGGGDKNSLIIDPIPSIQSGWIVDIAPFSEVSKGTNQKSKTFYAFIDPTLFVVSGISNTQFTVSMADAAKVVVGQYVKVHNKSYSYQSPEVLVTDLTGTTVTVQSSLGFTPALGDMVDLVGFKDNSGAYRVL